MDAMTFIDERIKSVLFMPLGWGSFLAAEMIVLTLLELKAVYVSSSEEQVEASLKMIFDQRLEFLCENFPGKQSIADATSEVGGPSAQFRISMQKLIDQIQDKLPEKEGNP